jgi:hypothetical protein
MDWDAFFALLKRYPYKTAAGVAAIFIAASSFTGYMLHTEECHKKGVSAYEGVETLTRIHEDTTLRKRAEAEAIAALCRSGQLEDKPVSCAKAEAAISLE